MFDSINSQGGYSTRVRRLGEFHPTMSTATATDAQDLDDPLYGNANNETEKVRNPLLQLCSCYDITLQMRKDSILLICPDLASSGVLVCLKLAASLHV